MKSLGAIAIALTLGVVPAWAADYSKSGKSAQYQKDAGKAKSMGQAKIEGKVQQVGQEDLTLSVAGSEVKLSADKQQLQGLKEGDKVQVTAVPLPEAEQITAMQQATPTQRQQAQQEPQKSITGSIENIQEDVVTVKTQGMGSQHIKVEQQQAQTLQKGGQYMFQLSSAPDEAKEWKAVKVKKM